MQTGKQLNKDFDFFFAATTFHNFSSNLSQNSYKLENYS